MVAKWLLRHPGSQSGDKVCHVEGFQGHTLLSTLGAIVAHSGQLCMCACEVPLSGVRNRKQTESDLGPDRPQTAKGP